MKNYTQVMCKIVLKLPSCIARLLVQNYIGNKK